MPKLLPVTCHTDQVGPDTTFVAITGVKERGVTYVPLALQRGARTIVVQNDEVVDNLLLETYGARLIRVENARKALAEMSAAAWSYPARKLKIIAVTGTKGKTTTTHLIKHILEENGYTVALLSSVGNAIGDQVFPARLTTEQPDYLHAFFHRCLEAGVEWVVMEVAAQAVSLYRTHGLLFDALVYTNFSYEHAEFYVDQTIYFKAKASLIGQLKPEGKLILNGDDAQIASLCNSQALLYGMSPSSLVHGKIHASGKPILSLEIALPGERIAIDLEGLLGEYNAYNVLAAVLCAFSLGIPARAIEKGLLRFEGVPGRLRRYELDRNIVAFIDHAHNPASFQAILSTLRPLTSELIVIFGAGGERDSLKRPLMGTIAAHLADWVYLTTDNPRSEDPLTIIRDIEAGIPDEHRYKVTVELDRSVAIHKAYERASPGSMVALLGKGCEEYQIVGQARLYFSEARILESLKA